MNLEILTRLQGKPILVGYRGSIAHGLYIPPEQENGTDDTDLMAVSAASPDYYFGLNARGDFNSRGTQEIMEGEWDIVNYELKKFVGLLSQSNPNVLSLLWIDEKHIVFQREAGRLLRNHRDLFVSKQIYNSFVGYARAQMERMTRGESAHGRGFMGAKRKELREKYGYDVKAASHAVRLLRMGIEFLEHGALFVDRTGLDASELIAIKQGKWTLGQVMDEVKSLFARAKMVNANSALPDEIDREKVSDLCVDILTLELSQYNYRIK